MTLLLISQENDVSIKVYICFLQPEGQTDGQNIHRKDANQSDISSQK